MWAVVLKCLHDPFQPLLTSNASCFALINVETRNKHGVVLNKVRIYCHYVNPRVILRNDQF